MSFSVDDHYCPPTPELWQGRQDAKSGERFYQNVHWFDLTHQQPPKSGGIALIGFCCDAGVIRNLGRPGARHAPNVIREQLAKWVCHPSVTLFDLGNIQCINQDLERAQDRLASLISQCHQYGLRTLVLGGGHETAWGHYQGLKSNYSEMKIINLDAHFDMREATEPSSGTPFLQIARDCKINNTAFDYCCLGVQPLSNSPSLYQTAEHFDVTYLTAQSMHTMTVKEIRALIESQLSTDKPIYLSLCMDVIAQAFAPGVSAPQPLGLLPWQVSLIIETLMQSNQVISTDIVELSPALDVHAQTASLASQYAAAMLAFPSISGIIQG